MRDTASRTTRKTSSEGLRLGERLRQLRVAAGLTQSELAGDRFSKEYVSQIERGKTRPTAETIGWLADRLGIDAGFLASGVATDERAQLEGALTRAEALYEANEDEEAVDAFEPLVAAARATGVPELQVRALSGAGFAKMGAGDHQGALALLNEARAISEAESLSDVERADVLYRLGCCRYQLSSTQTALSLFNEALALAERSGVDPAKVREALLGGFAGSKILEVHGQRMLDRAFTPGFRVRLHRKDARIVTEAAREAGASTPAFAVVEEQFQRLVDEGGGDLDHAALITLLDEAFTPRAG